MLVNSNYEQEVEVNLTLSIPGRSLQERARADGSWLPGRALKEGRPAKLRFKLAPGDGRLFRVVP